MKSHSQWLESLIDDLNYDTLIEEPWCVVFRNKKGHHIIMGNSHKYNIFVCGLDREIAEFPTIRQELKHSSEILQVCRSSRMGKGMKLPEKYKKVFRVDTIFEEQKECAVLLDREDNIIEKMQLQEALDFVEAYKIPVGILDFRHRFENHQYIFLEGCIIPIASEDTIDV
jgi:hypothetical protein